MGGNIIKSFAETGDVASTQVGETHILSDYKADDLIIGGKNKFGYTDLDTRLSAIKKQLKTVIPLLNDEEKFILELPLHEWQLGYEFGAYCMLNWLEGSTNSLKFEYNKFMSFDRLKNIDTLSINEYFSNIRYLSVENLGFTPSGGNLPNKFLFNNSISSVKDSYNLLLNEYKEYVDNGELFGNYENFNLHISGNKVKNNYFNSTSLGSDLGDFDDVGVSLGKFSLRMYFRGYFYTLNSIKNSIKTLIIEDIATRFVDTYSFKDTYSWFSQSLGCWNININEPGVSRTGIFNNNICIENIDFRNLRTKANDKGVKLGGDFLIYSDRKIYNYDKVQKKIMVYN